jgi:P27 family predicted phage terminase small subunit
VPRPAKTDQQHRLEGTVSQVGRTNSTQVASRYAGGRPQIPQHLDKLARSEFKRVCHELEHRKTLTSGDRTTIAVLAECYARWVTAKKELGTDYTITVTITDKQGHIITTVKANPLLKVVEVCEARILSLQTALGLTPQARDRVRPTQPDALPEEISFEDSYLNNLNDRSRVVPIRQEEMTAGGEDEDEASR